MVLKQVSQYIKDFESSMVDTVPTVRGHMYFVYINTAAGARKSKETTPELKYLVLDPLVGKLHLYK